MKICFRINGVWRCFYVPVLVELPKLKRPVPDGPHDYEALIDDASLVAHVQAVAAHATDKGVREALHAGTERALTAMQERAGDDVRIGDKELERSASS
jgi:hypothetical protein